MSLFTPFFILVFHVHGSLPYVEFSLSSADVSKHLSSQNRFVFLVFVFSVFRF